MNSDAEKIPPAAGEPTGDSSGCAIFLLDNLPFEPEEEVDPSVQSEIEFSIENLAETYMMPLKEIVSSCLNAAGFVRAIYFHFGPRGYYELNPNSRAVTCPGDFKATLSQLFETGMIMNHGTNEVVWNKITDLSSLISKLPANSRKIGCLHGEESQGSNLVEFRDYIRSASDKQCLVLVVGKIANQEIHRYIDDFVKVSEYDLIPVYLLDSVIKVLEAKRGM